MVTLSGSKGPTPTFHEKSDVFILWSLFSVWAIAGSSGRGKLQCCFAMDVHHGWHFLALWPWPLTYDLDLWTWPRYHQAWSTCQYSGLYVRPFGQDSETDGQIHRQKDNAKTITPFADAGCKYDITKVTHRIFSLLLWETVLHLWSPIRWEISKQKHILRPWLRNYNWFSMFSNPAADAVGNTLCKTMLLWTYPFHSLK